MMIMMMMIIRLLLVIVRTNSTKRILEYKGETESSPTTQRTRTDHLRRVRKKLHTSLL